jgi:hypothetical protein
LVDFRQYLEDIHYCEPNADSIYSALLPLLRKGVGQDTGHAIRSAAIHQAFGAKRGVLAYSALYSQMMTGTVCKAQERRASSVPEDTGEMLSGAKRDEIH